MIERYEEFDNYRVLPISNNRIEIDIFGNCLVDGVFAPEIKVDGDIFFTLRISGKNEMISKAVLASAASRKIHIQVILRLAELRVFFQDGNSENTHPSNTVWKYPLLGLRVSPTSQLYHIPGFSRYAISPNGNVYSFCSQKFLSPYQDQMGYWMFGLTPDIGKRTIIGQHRLLSLAFVPYPANVSELDVNHIDGVKSNNNLSNLEWVDRKRNCDHAYRTGLRTDNIPVLVMNSFTGIVSSYYSYEECGRKLEIDGETVRLRALSEGKKVYYPGYQVKREDCHKEWIKYSDPVKHMTFFSPNIPYILENQENGKVIRLSNTKEVAAFFGITPGGVNWYINTKGDGCIIKGYRVCRETLQSKISPLLVETP